jgi:hypothetical protein
LRWPTRALHLITGGAGGATDIRTLAVTTTGGKTPVVVAARIHAEHAKWGALTRQPGLKAE